ncbi:hypothetical protein ABFS82_03G105200 [Erythranthe guttata]
MTEIVRCNWQSLRFVASCDIFFRLLVTSTLVPTCLRRDHRAFRTYFGNLTFKICLWCGAEEDIWESVRLLIKAQECVSIGNKYEILFAGLVCQGLYLTKAVKLSWPVRPVRC